MNCATYVFIGLTIFLLIVVLFLIKRVLSLKQKPIGTLRIDSSDPDDGPYLFLELNQSIADVKLQDKKFVILAVDATNYLSQK